eukprot:169756-Chlamydomonas_euryale.AAC.1
MPGLEAVAAGGGASMARVADLVVSGSGRLSSLPSGSALDARAGSGALDATTADANHGAGEARGDGSPPPPPPPPLAGKTSMPMET